jgi:acrylyl-CoA reductase (NADPH)
MSETFDAYVLEEQGPAVLRQLTDQDLPDGDVTIDVRYSSLNYKDGLALTGKGKIARSFPMVCGIDLAGTVAVSASPDWHPGDEVIVTGWGLSETRPGGYTRRQRVDSHMLTRKPDGLSLPQTMAIGTAGLTAMLCVLRLEQAGLAPGRGPVVVTGAAGGVGSVAVAVLAGLGHEVHAATGRAAVHDYLRGLGAAALVDRSELAEGSKRPLESEKWAGGVDSVGSTTLATVLKQTRYGGSVAACGLAGGSDLPTTVLPFILRGVSLLGINSVTRPFAERQQAWQALADTLDLAALDTITTEIGLDAAIPAARDLLEGRVRGRIVVDVNR